MYGGSCGMSCSTGQFGAGGIEFFANNSTETKGAETPAPKEDHRSCQYTAQGEFKCGDEKAQASKDNASPLYESMFKTLFK